jgi:predicted NACHT family NTPase
LLSVFVVPPSAELYKEGLDALLKKWDAKRGIQRDQIYKKLSVQRKEDLLSKIALTTFEKSEYSLENLYLSNSHQMKLCKVW